MKDIIKRINKMEKLYTKIDKVINKFEKALIEFKNIQNDVIELEKYYTGKEYKNDYELDENNKLPKDLKRGILAQDSIYNLLEKNDELKKELKKKYWTFKFDKGLYNT